MGENNLILFIISGNHLCVCMFVWCLTDVNMVHRFNGEKGGNSVSN